MNINELLVKADFCSVVPQKYELNEGDILNYYCCKKSLQNQCVNECNACENIYARYIVINLCEEKTFEICNKHLFSSIEAFENFQKEHLAKLFFYENDIVRYNIYLVFLCNDKTIFDSLDNKEKIIDNTNYARKLFLNKEEFIEYFCFYKTINELSDKNEFSNDKKIFHKMSEIITALDKKSMKSIVLPQKDNKEYLSLLFDYIMGEQNFDRYTGTKGTAADFIRTHFYKTDEKNRDRVVRVKNIKKIIIKQFRKSCFDDNTIIDCAKVNVLFGPNATGKSSILDAIEFGFTGETHRYKEDQSLNNSSVEIITCDSRTYNNPADIQKDKLKRQWYPYYLGTLNELFCRINFFDTDATYRFALEQGKSEDAFIHIKKLLCNSKLLDAEKSLNCYLENIDFFVALQNKHEKKSDDYQSVPMLKFFSKIIRPSFNEGKTKSYQKLDEFKRTIEDTLKTIQYLINNQISSNIKIINIIFRRLFSYEYNVVWRDDTILLTNLNDDKIVSINAMSTAQKVCLALSVIFTQFLLAESSPQFILLDESVANFDSLHLLNLLDFLRELSNEGVQIFLTTANDDVAKVALCKFKFLENDFNLYQISRTEEGSSRVSLLK